MLCCHARYSDMSARKRELCFLVHGDGERCVVEVTYGMAAFTAVVVGILGELAVELMANLFGRRRHGEERCRTCGDDEAQLHGF